MTVNSTAAESRKTEGSVESERDLADLKEVLAISPIFRGLSAQHIDALIRSARIERFAADQTIWNEGDKPDRLALIIKGDVDASLGDTLREIVSSESRGG